MKHTALLVLALALTACSKEEKTIRYQVDCNSCAVEYVQGDSWNQTYVRGTPVLDTTFADTVIVDVDTVGWNPTVWDIEFDEAQDFTPHLKSRIVPGNETTARIFVDGVKTAEGSSRTYGEEVSL